MQSKKTKQKNKSKTTFDFTDLPTGQAGFRLYGLNRGFSLIEMMVVLAIVAFVSSTIFANFPKMNSKLSLDLLTQDIALTVRQAQIYGTTVFGVGVAGTEFGDAAANFQAYGVSFPSPEIRDNDGNYVYTLFADVPAAEGEAETSNTNSTKNRYNEGTQVCMNGSYKITCLAAACGNPGTNNNQINECSQRFIVTGKNEVELLCLNYFSGGGDKDARVKSCRNLQGQDCRPGILTKPDDGSSVDIVFNRPKLQAEITTRCSNQYFSPENVGIILKSDSGEDRVVVVWKNGQISVDR